MINIDESKLVKGFIEYMYENGRSEPGSFDEIPKNANGAEIRVHYIDENGKYLSKHEEYHIYIGDGYNIDLCIERAKNPEVKKELRQFKKEGVKIVIIVPGRGYFPLKRNCVGVANRRMFEEAINVIGQKISKVQTRQGQKRFSNLPFKTDTKFKTTNLPFDLNTEVKAVPLSKKTGKR